MTRRDALAAGAGGISGILLDASRFPGRSDRRATALGRTEGAFQQATGGWSQTATLTADELAPKDRFGYAVAIHGDRALVGADSDDENGTDAGAAYVFELEDGRWRQTQKLTADDGGADDRFGDVVVLDDGRAFVGARRNDSRAQSAGAAYVFELEGDEWRQTQKLVAEDAASNDRFGRGIALDGSRALIGARRRDEGAKDTGAAYVFELQGDEWRQTQTLTAEDADADDRFGRAVALAGSRALVGARIDDGAAPDAGAVYVFELLDGTWQQTQKITAADANQGDRFGGAVALGGDQALVGAGRDDEIAENGGAGYSFRFSGGDWRQTQKLTPDDPPSPGTRFGSTIALQRDVAFVGAAHDSEQGKNAGAVFVFQREGGRWRQTQKVLNQGDAAGSRFGSSISIDGNRVLVGAMHDGAVADKGGAAYLLTREDAPGATGPSDGDPSLLPSPLALLALGGGVAAAIAAVALIFGSNLAGLVPALLGRDDEEPPAELLSDEERVVRLLEDNGGRMKQQDVKEELDWSQTKTSNVVTDLQDDGKIEVYRLGNENTLALPGEIDI